ncbi:Presenilin-1 [Linnemannia schmuckeri]|uniref:Presenilin n=1 Tax=Linnemannia schmuckeri TaxID=64567 RepID=A0A9P5S5T0_9FUNG|nr:Presenilin-1 [Linnemannia schmuckeri]
MSSPAARGVTAPSGQTSSSSSSSTQPSDRTITNTQALSSRAGADSRASARSQQDTPVGIAAAAGGGDNGQDNDDGEDQPCQACGVFPARFQCSACQSVRYCSQECQASDWKIHYRECAEIVAAQKEEQIESQQGAGRPRSGANGTRETDVPGDRYSTDMEMTSRAAASPSRSGAAGEVLGDEGENIRATANRPRRRPREPRRRPRLTPEQRAAYEEAERIADMKFYMLQIYKIIKPVVVCICLSILWVKISMAGSDYRPTQSSYTVYKESPNSTASQNFLGSLANAGIIIGQIVIVTIIIVVLFKRGHIKVLIGFFMVVVAMLLGFMGYILILNLIQVLRIPLDYLTMVFALWNFSVTGLISVFWKGPMWVQQMYLTVMSSLMAFSLTGLAEWTTWMLLALLVVWDLIAVLCPFGPLKILVESSRNQNQEVPALLYTVNAVWFMASPPDAILNRETLKSKESLDSEDVALNNDSSSPRTNFHGGHSRATGRDGGASISSSRNSGLDASFSAHGGMSRTSSTMALVPSPNGETGDRDTIELRERARSGDSRNPPRSHGEGSPLAGRVARSASGREGLHRDPRRDSREDDDEEEQREASDEDDDDDGGGLKLGLGDFVFYSVLVARAAMFDWVTTMCCMVAVLTGMNATIFLLAIYQKALPALPISICFGMLFYFATRFALVPFLAVLARGQVFI